MKCHIILIASDWCEFSNMPMNGSPNCCERYVALVRPLCSGTFFEPSSFQGFRIEKEFSIRCLLRRSLADWQLVSHGAGYEIRLRCYKHRGWHPRGVSISGNYAEFGCKAIWNAFVHWHYERGYDRMACGSNSSQHL